MKLMFVLSILFSFVHADNLNKIKLEQLDKKKYHLSKIESKTKKSIYVKHRDFKKLVEDFKKSDSKKIVNITPEELKNKRELYITIKDKNGVKAKKNKDMNFINIENTKRIDNLHVSTKFNDLDIDTNGKKINVLNIEKQKGRIKNFTVDFEYENIKVE